MTADDLRNYVKATPFLPLVIHMGNSRSVEVNHPEMILITDEAAAVSVEKDGRSSLRLLALININEIEVAAATK